MDVIEASINGTGLCLTLVGGASQRINGANKMDQRRYSEGDIEKYLQINIVT